VSENCLDCHDAKNRKGGVLLTGDRGPEYSHSYYELMSRLQVADGRDLPRGNYAPRKLGSSASFLMNKIDGSHHDVKLSEKETRKIKLWIDASANYPGTYAALGSGMLNQRGVARRELEKANEVMDRRCAGCHKNNTKLPDSPVAEARPDGRNLVYNNDRKWTPPWVKPFGDGSLRVGSKEWMQKYAPPGLVYSKHILYNLSVPEDSVMLLAPLAKEAGGYGTCPDVFKNQADPDYQILLQSIQASKQGLEKITRFDMENFQPTEGYIREMKRYGIVPPEFEYGEPINVYETDRRYWESLH